jgi:hypothetical protein
MELRSQSCDVVRNDSPNKFKIDAKVLVDDHIAEADDLRPRDLWVSFADF